MSPRELQRSMVLALVLAGQVSESEASKRLKLSCRQVRRLVVKLREQGVAGLAHGNRGRKAWNRIPVEIKSEILELAMGPYELCNDTHMAELLAERDGIRIGRETLRGLLRSAGREPKRKRRSPRHHRRRERSTAKGLMILWDGSLHRWFGPERPLCTLMAAIDDADGELLAAFLTGQETTESYLLLLRSVLHAHGIPVSIYQDRHSALRRSDDSWSLEEQLAGRQRPTQVGLALEDLGIQPIFALSPQAKGRVERLFGTLQDRLVAELHLGGITEIAEANTFLTETFLARFNQRFRLESPHDAVAFRSTLDCDLRKILSFRYQASVRNDNTVRLGGTVLDIPPGPRRRSYAKAKVDVRQHLDGSWSVYFRGVQIAEAPPSPLAEPLRHKKRTQSKTKAAFEEFFLYLPDPHPGIPGQNRPAVVRTY